MCLKRTVKPSMTVQQAELERLKCGRLFQKYRDLDFICMTDEMAYFTRMMSEIIPTMLRIKLRQNMSHKVLCEWLDHLDE